MLCLFGCIFGPFGDRKTHVSSLEPWCSTVKQLRRWERNATRQQHQKETDMVEPTEAGAFHIEFNRLSSCGMASMPLSCREIQAYSAAECRKMQKSMALQKATAPTDLQPIHLAAKRENAFPQSLMLGPQSTPRPVDFRYRSSGTWTL